MKFSKKGNNPAWAVSCFFRGLRWALKPELRKFIVIPVLINLVLYSAVLVLGYYYVADLIAHFIPDWLSWLSWVLWPLFFLSFFIAGFFTFTIVANVIAAPFYGALSVKSAELITGRKLEIGEHSVNKIILAEFKRFGYLGSRALPLLIVSIIPGINIAAPFLWGLFGAWGAALEYMAYPLENAGLLFSEQRKILKSIRLGSMSFGGITMLGLTLPIVNIIVAPAAVIGATIYVLQAGEGETTR
ncbi:MAG: sulfate transporter CysZ [Methylomicrobium sp.]|nr:sulfate transporter CysZ [Methylomicrobium sp.]